MGVVVEVSFNIQQLELVDRAVAAGAGRDRAAVLRRALAELGEPAPAAPREEAPPTRAAPLDATRRLRFEQVIEPGTGKAVEVRAGQILRIAQTEGGQCVDFNCFNLHDYKEPMHVGRSRAMYGLNPTEGAFLWSAPPRERAMMYILRDTYRRNDVLFARCNAYLYESVYGFATHTNCHDIQAEAQREYGLTPDDVHDSFNFFMATHVADTRCYIDRQTSTADDYVELLAVMDVLAVPNVCGNDVGRTSNFRLKPIALSLWDASPRDLAAVPQVREYPTNRRGPATFRQPTIKADRPLRRDPGYVPAFDNVPLRSETVALPLSDDEVARLRGAGLAAHYGDDLAATLRDVALSWWEQRFTRLLPGSDT